MTPGSSPRVRPHLLLLAALGVLVLAVPAVRQTLGHGFVLLAMGQLGQFQQYLRSLGVWAPVASVAFMASEALLVPVPITIIMVANGLVFGLWWGMLVSFAGGLAGALAAYSVGRYLGRTLVERWLPISSLTYADRLMRRYGGWAVVLERWIPGVPCDPVSYASGVTRMPALRFVALTTVGLVPANFATAFLGTEVAGDVPFKYWLTGCALAVVAYVVYRSLKASATSGRTAAASTPPESHP